MESVISKKPVISRGAGISVNTGLPCFVVLLYESDQLGITSLEYKFNFGKGLDTKEAKTFLTKRGADIYLYGCKRYYISSIFNKFLNKIILLKETESFKYYWSTKRSYNYQVCINELTKIEKKTLIDMCESILLIKENAIELLPGLNHPDRDYLFNFLYSIMTFCKEYLNN